MDDSAVNKVIENVTESLERLRPADPELLNDFMAVKNFIDAIAGNRLLQ